MKLEIDMSDFEKFMREQLKWNETHAKADEDRHIEISKQITAEFENVNQRLNPMSDNFIATKKLGKWVLATLSLIAIILTIISQTKNIWK